VIPQDAGGCSVNSSLVTCYQQVKGQVVSGQGLGYKRLIGLLFQIYTFKGLGLFHITGLHHSAIGGSAYMDFPAVADKAQRHK
jgi:hypothetical protein